MIELQKINPDLPDAAFDLDGTVKKFNTLEVYTEWLCQQAVFDPLPQDIIAAKRAWKEDNTEQRYVDHTNKLVRFFIEQVPGKSVSQLTEAANIVAEQQRHRRWNITTAIIKELQLTHNIIAISHMPEWLMESFVRDLGFVALIGSTYVAQNGLFTEEARGINKATEYAKIRGGDTSRLDVHMGDTVGDSPLFALAKRPIAFNSSWTLRQETDSMTHITSHKDVVTVINPSTDDPAHNTASVYGPPFDVPTILSEIRENSYRAT